MTNCNEETRCLSSLAVFRELYNSNKDVYVVISEFIDNLITSTSKYKFNITEITNIFNETYDFKIPEAVVRTALGKLDYLSKDMGNYFVDTSKFPEKKQNNVLSLHQKINEKNNEIISNLFKYIEKEKKLTLEEVEKEKIVHSFCSFLLDNSNGENYTEYISAFLVDNKIHESFRESINQIREGVILYSGLKYNTNISETGSWRNELTIYLDTEVLFHFAGYNGEIFKNHFYDFYNFVREINSGSSTRLINLNYFTEVKDEIISFFNKAKDIIEKKDYLIPKGTAMFSILDGCSESSDIEDKKSDFFLSLKTSGIHEENTANIYSKSNYDFNIINSETVETLSQELGIDVNEHLNFLNLISIKRNFSHTNNFENIGYILLTGNTNTLKVAWHNAVKPEYEVPLATTLNFLTNKFWFKLNKGFGSGAFPKSFDIITKAQIFLSSALSNSLSTKYDELQEKYKSGKITEEQAKARIVNLRNNIKKPEEIKNEDISSILHTISEDSLEQFIKEQEFFKNQAEKNARENVYLKKDLTNKDKALKKSEETSAAVLIKSLKNRIQDKEALLSEKKDHRTNILKQKLPLDNEAKKSYTNFKAICFISVIVLYLVVILIVWYLKWETLEPWSYIVGILISNIFPLLFIIVKEKNINPLKYLSDKKDYIINKTYFKFNFSIDKLNLLQNEIEQLEKEITEIKLELEKYND